MSYEYYDEDYFQHGEKKGTAYSNYIQGSRTSAIYREIADAIAEAFRPKRALEVGCATGIVVRHLNDLGVEAHGIDVSEWAITNREHPNVVLAGVEALPFPDNHFDLVYSVHALEHVPEHLKEAAFAELARVGDGAVHFHMLPIIGLGPYRGDPDSVVAGLKRDPTHSLLHDRSWWLREFARFGLHDLKVGLHFSGESGSSDLGESQILLANGEAPALLDRIRAWNAKVVSYLLARAQRAEQGVYAPMAPGEPTAASVLRLKGRWDDVEFVPECLVLDRAQTMTATVSVRADAPITLRFCFIGKDGSEADLCKTYRPGTTTFAVPLRDLQSRIGEIFGTHVVRIVFGGAGNAAVSVAMAVHDGEAAIYAGEQMAQVVGAREQMKLATTAPADGMAKSNRLSFALRAGLRAYRNASASA